MLTWKDKWRLILTLTIITLIGCVSIAITTDDGDAD